MCYTDVMFDNVTDTEKGLFNSLLAEVCFCILLLWADVGQHFIPETATVRFAIAALSICVCVFIGLAIGYFFR